MTEETSDSSLGRLPLQPFAAGGNYNRRPSLQGCPKDKGVGILAHIE